MSSFVGHSEAIKARILDGPQVWKMINDKGFIDSKLEKEKEAWPAFAHLVCNFKAENYEKLGFLTP